MIRAPCFHGESRMVELAGQYSTSVLLLSGRGGALRNFLHRTTRDALPSPCYEQGEGYNGRVLLIISVGDSTWEYPWALSWFPLALSLPNLTREADGPAWSTMIVNQDHTTRCLFNVFS